MKKEIRFHVPNSLLFVQDYEYGELPEALGSGLVTSTQSSIVVGTRPDFEGPVDIVLTVGPRSNEDDASHLVWSGKLHTPNREISVCSVNLDRLLSIEVNSQHPLVEVWVNDDQEPDRILIVVTSDDHDHLQ